MNPRATETLTNVSNDMIIQFIADGVERKTDRCPDDVTSVKFLHPFSE